MKYTVELYYSNRWNKRFKVIIRNNLSLTHRVLHFGYGRTYLDHNNKMIKMNYLKGRPECDNPMKEGFWIRWLLWSAPNLIDAMELISEKFSVEFD